MKLHAHYYLVGLRWKARKEAKASAVVLKLQKLQGSDIRRAGKGKGPEAGRKRACGFADVSVNLALLGRLNSPFATLNLTLFSSVSASTGNLGVYH